MNIGFESQLVENITKFSYIYNTLNSIRCLSQIRHILSRGDMNGRSKTASYSIDTGSSRKC
jgi:hypothetical protein